MRKNIYLDLHVIQTLPPSCVNRDDTGSPKTAVYGGTMRARVSSQAWKRAVRQTFIEEFPEERLGIRTRNTVDLIKNEIMDLDNTISEDKAGTLAEQMLSLGGAKGEGKDVLFFISKAQINELARVSVEYEQDEKEYGSGKKATEAKNKSYKKKVSEALINNPGIDMVLFGRMAASNAALNYDAACQVAHAISTHTVHTEFDYFSAVDDHPLDQENSGAGHLGTVEFNSSTLYRYATLNIRGVEKYIEVSEIPDIATAFSKAFILSMPSGKQNTFANRTVPDMVYVTVRTDQPVNLVGAFEKPVYAGTNGYVELSEKRLEEYAMGLYQNFISLPEQSWVVGKNESDLSASTTFVDMLEQIRNSIKEQLER